MLKYKVSIGYRDFMFDNAASAMSFAQTAKLTYCDEEGKTLDVEIELIDVNNADEICEN